ncbi:MAG: UpxY family transcription antiterminator [Acidobacteriia bacterium]|nr:UpxY family transcription antiterminator [Terriglobia bacterium]
MHSSDLSTALDLGMPQPGPSGHWHAVHTRYQHEKSVVQALSGKGHHVFLPLYGATHLWRRRPVHLQLPLFPGYLFLQGGLDRQFQILSTPGVVGLVKSGVNAAIVPHEQIAAVRRLVEGSSRVEPHEYLHTGDRVMVTSGSLQGIEGILIRTKGAFRMVVSMELLGRAAAVEIDISCVQRVCQPLPAARPRRIAAIA